MVKRRKLARQRSYRIKPFTQQLYKLLLAYINEDYSLFKTFLNK